MNSTTLKNTLRRAWNHRITAVITLVAVVLVSYTAMEPASALYVLSGLEEDVLVLDDDTDLQTVDISSKLVQVGQSKQGVEVTLQAGQSVTIHHLDATVYAQTKDETISQLLSRLQISLSPLEMILVEFDSNDVTLTIDTTLTYYETTTETQPYKTQYLPNVDMLEGTETVIQQGYDGAVTATYEVIYADGALLSRQLVEQTDSTVQDELIHYGTKIPALGIDDPLADVIHNDDGSGTLVFASGKAVPFSGTKNMTATAYTANVGKVGTITATGTNVHVGVIAVDKRVIPLGTEMFVVTNDGIVYGMGVAEDTGVIGDIVDLYHNTYDQCIQFGRRGCVVYFV